MLLAPPPSRCCPPPPATFLQWPWSDRGIARWIAWGVWCDDVHLRGFCRTNQRSLPALPFQRGPLDPGSPQPLSPLGSRMRTTSTPGLRPTGCVPACPMGVCAGPLLAPLGPPLHMFLAARLYFFGVGCRSMNSNLNQFTKHSKLFRQHKYPPLRGAGGEGRATEVCPKSVDFSTGGTIWIV